jgi:formate dehydrogenase gamma subunit
MHLVTVVLAGLLAPLAVFAADEPETPDWMHATGDGSRTAWEQSAHFKEGVKCIACHGSGDEPKASLEAELPQKWIEAEAVKISPRKRAEYDVLCVRCHDSAEQNFRRTFHGKHARLGKKNIPTCSYCHVGHEPPLASIHNALSVDTLGRVCAGCHGGSDEEGKRLMATNLAGTLTGPTLYGHDPFGWGKIRGKNIIDGFYILLLTGAIGFLAFYIAVDIPVALQDRRNGNQQKFYRLTMGQRLQHGVLALTFITLALTGFAILYADSAYAQWLTSLLGGPDNRSLIHRLAALLFVANAYLHFVYYIFVYHGPRTISFSRQDLRDVWQDIRFRLGKGERPVHTGKYDWLQKLEYWASVIGLHVVLVTGLLMWFFDSILSYLPYQIFKYAQWIHGWEAILATSVVILLHGYSTILSPRVFPMDRSWIKGRKKM